MEKLAIIVTHPIQYYVPVFCRLHQWGNLEVMVFYTWGENAVHKYDPGFERKVEWDIPLLEGYPYCWVKNTAKDAGSHHFFGIHNPGLVRQIEQWKATALLVFGWSNRSHLNIIRHFKGKVPVYFRGDSTLLDQRPGLKNTLRSVFLKWLYRYVDHAFYVGQNSKSYFEAYGMKQEELTFAPHAVDNERFARNREAEAKQLRMNLQIPDAATLVLFAGKLEEKKSPLLLLEAFLKLNDPDVHLLFAGSGPLLVQLTVIAAGRENIHFMDFQNQSAMPLVYQAADLFCLPSKGPGETWGLAVNEAMACGKAILVSDKVGCAADLIKNKVNGLTFESENAEELLSCLRLLTPSRNSLKVLGQQSSMIIKDWSFDHCAAAIEEKIVDNKTA